MITMDLQGPERAEAMSGLAGPPTDTLALILQVAGDLHIGSAKHAAHAVLLRDAVDLLRRGIPLQWLTFAEMLTELTAEPSFWVSLAPSVDCLDWFKESDMDGRREFGDRSVFRRRQDGTEETLVGEPSGTETCWDAGISIPQVKERNMRRALPESLFFQIPGRELLDTMLEIAP